MIGLPFDITIRLSLTVLAVLAICGAARAAEPTRPNILWIVVDDMSANFGCYGETTIATPNVDAMAKAGTRFSNAFVTAPVGGLNAFISVAALIVGFAQMVFLFNIFWSLKHGRDAGGNPGRAASLEWQTPETPPGHGNWGRDLPVVYRWAYDYSVPGAPQDFLAQDDPWPNRPADSPA